jgi:hypothetical protein
MHIEELTMEIDVTNFFTMAAPSDYSASCAEIGQDAGRVTWQAAIEDSEYYLMLDSEYSRDAFKNYVREFGAWDDADIAALSDIELNALFMQFVAGDIRESVFYRESEWDWDAYYADAAAGRISGRLFLGIDNRIYYYIGN